MDADRHRELRRLSLADAPASGGTFEAIYDGNNLWEWLVFELTSSHDGGANGVTFAISYDNGQTYDNVTFYDNAGARQSASSYTTATGVQRYKAKMRPGDKAGALGPIKMRIRFVNSANTLARFRGSIYQANDPTD